MKTIKIFVSCALCVLPFTGCGQTVSKPQNTETVRAFVQNFYDWYVPVALHGGGSSPAWIMAVKEKQGSFAPDLASKLRDDAAAQAKAEGEIVGLDFDPFLYAQDPGSHYGVGKISQKGDAYFAEIHQVVHGRPVAKITVTAQAACPNAHCYFVNFLYPDGGGLLNILQELKASRSKP